MTTLVHPLGLHPPVSQVPEVLFGQGLSCSPDDLGDVEDVVHRPLVGSCHQFLQELRDGLVSAGVRGCHSVPTRSGCIGKPYDILCRDATTSQWKTVVWCFIRRTKSLKTCIFSRRRDLWVFLDPRNASKNGSPRLSPCRDVVEMLQSVNTASLHREVVL